MGTLREIVGGAVGRYALALATVLVLTGVSLAAYPYAGSAAAAVFMLGILVVVRYGGPGPAVLALALSILVTDYFLTIPRFDWGLSANDVVWLSIFAVISLSLIGFAESFKRAAGRMRERDESFQVTLSSIGDAVITVDTKGHITFLNPVAESLTGYRMEEARSQPLQRVCNLLTEKDRKPATPRFLQAMPEATPAANGYILVDRSGTERPVEESASPLRDSHGRLRGTVLVFRDVTARRQAEKALRDSSLFARVTLDALHANVCVLDERGGIVAVNKSWRHFARTYGLQLADNGIGANYLAVCDAAAFEGNEDGAEFAAAIRAVIRGEQDSFFREYNITLDGRISWHIGRVTRFPGAGPRRVVVTHEDITPLKQAQQQLRALNETLEQRVAERTQEVVHAQEALRQSERLAVLGQMTAVLGHESRNALQRIQTSMDLLERRLRDNPDAMRLILETRRAQEDLKRVHEEVRSYVAPLVLEKTVVGLPGVWRQAWLSLEPARRGRLAALLESFEGIDTACCADVFRIQQVFRNLFENSLAACTDPVQIFVRCTVERVGEEDTIRVSVRDNGPGLAPGQEARIFEPFYTTKAKGTGLGMAIVQRIVEAHGGRVWTEPSNPRGLEVVFEFPRGCEPPVEPPTET